jgi:hypothetical protein
LTEVIGMHLTVYKKGFTLIGKVRDLKNLFEDWPAEMTLSDFIFLQGR